MFFVWCSASLAYSRFPSLTESLENSESKGRQQLLMGMRKLKGYVCVPAGRVKSVSLEIPAASCDFLICSGGKTVSTWYNSYMRLPN